MVTENTKTVATNLISNLKKAGFVVNRYDSHTSNSIYLILDNGACNKVRISDHYGRKHRYNVILGLEKSYKEVSKSGSMYFFSEKHINRLVNEIKARKASIIVKLGFEGYLNRQLS